MTTRAEFFVTRGRGRWSKCRVPFRCEREIHTPCGSIECGKEVRAGDLYLTTDIHKHPVALARAQTVGLKPERWAQARRRYCFACANTSID
jgi:hypothetical protein